MHSYIEGIGLELGNFRNYLTFTADPSAQYRDNSLLRDFATIHDFPNFSYESIVNEAKKIDVIWFNEKGLVFPKAVFEVVDSLQTLNDAFNSCWQLKNFITDFYIIALDKHHDKFECTVNIEAYRHDKKKFSFINYDKIREYYEIASKKNKLENDLFIHIDNIFD